MTDEAAPRAVVIRYPGQNDTYEVASEAAAAEFHPDAEIVGYAGSFEPFGTAAGEPPPDPPANAPVETPFIELTPLQGTPPAPMVTPVEETPPADQEGAEPRRGRSK